MKASFFSIVALPRRYCQSLLLNRTETKLQAITLTSIRSLFPSASSSSCSLSFSSLFPCASLSFFLSPFSFSFLGNGASFSSLEILDRTCSRNRVERHVHLVKSHQRSEHELHKEEQQKRMELQRYVLQLEKEMTIRQEVHGLQTLPSTFFL